MAKTKTEVDKDEVEEIIDLYIKENGGMVSELKYKAISDFNAHIASEGVLRANGNPFKLYRYNFWGGSYDGKFNYGKRAIIERNNKNKVHVIGPQFDADVVDIIGCVNDLHKKPQELIDVLVKIFQKERKKIKELNEELDEKNKKLDAYKSKIEKMEKGYANLFFQSQSPSNSLNNMMSLSKSADSVCYDELKNMFGDLNRFDRIIQSQVNEKQMNNVTDINKQRKAQKLKDEGF
ncbi:hypothetical protein [Clostridium perfringens]|uniref:hypothetical protein n=1 Tax=Clostridium perfringens TaxID=1502 RepID=UPI002341D3B3|nr:hypothetical protein [Clostridium perfringens]MDC4243914.1 hypothetical protein [Clostridium perfringens]